MFNKLINSILTVRDTLLPPFLTAKQLDISEERRGALIKALRVMESGRVYHITDAEIDQDMDAGKFVDVCKLGPDDSIPFNMSHWCGTACCIGGLAEKLSGIDFGLPDEPTQGEDVLEELFHPQDVQDWDKIPVDVGAAALRRYLTTGKSDWDVPGVKKW